MSNGQSAKILSFADNFLRISPAFDELYKSGMTLVEEAAAYLDGQGREESKALNRSLKLVYSTETMRLTTRLMQAASWLLLMREKRQGDISASEVVRAKRSVDLNAVGTSEEVLASNLPEKLVELIRRSLTLMDKIQRLDTRLYPK